MSYCELGVWVGGWVGGSRTCFCALKEPSFWTTTVGKEPPIARIEPVLSGWGVGGWVGGWVGGCDASFL